MVETIINIIVAVALIMLFIGIINPRWGTFGLKPNWSRWKISRMYIILIIILSFLAYLVEEPGEQMTSNNTTSNSRVTLKKENFKEYAASNHFSEKELELALDNLSEIGLDEDRIERIDSSGIVLKTFEDEVDLLGPVVIKIYPNIVDAMVDGRRSVLFRDGKTFFEVNDIFLKKSALKKATKELEEIYNKKEGEFKLSELTVDNIKIGWDEGNLFFTIHYIAKLEKEIYGAKPDERFMEGEFYITPNGSGYIPSWK